MGRRAPKLKALVKRGVANMKRKSAPKRSVNFSGTIRKVRKPNRAIRTPAMYRNGMVIHQEFGANITDPKVVYIAHSTSAPSTILRSLVGTILKELFRKRGISFSKWQDTYTSDTTDVLQMVYYIAPDSTTQSAASYTITTGSSYLTIVDGWLAAMRTQITDNSVHEVVEFKLYRAGTNNTPLSRISGKALKITFDLTSVMTYQNQTLGGTTTTPEGDTEVVTSNPIRGVSYQGSGNGFFPYERQLNDASYEQFVANQDYGVFSRAAAQHLPDAGKEPPGGWFWKGAKKQGTAKCDPGQIKKSVLKTHRTIGIQKFMELFEEFWNASGDKIVQGFGTVRMFSLEKVLDSRLSENSVNVAWEVDYRCSTSLKYSNYVPTQQLNVIS